jgi:HPt (histidine-containing phosphotransfer) domain-containing protein
MKIIVSQPEERSENFDPTKKILDDTDEADYIFIETESFLKPRVAQYLENRRNDLVSIEDLIQKKDFESIATIGHNVSGTAGTYGMLGLTELSRKIEHAAMESNSEELLDLLKKIQKYLSKVRVK